MKEMAEIEEWRHGRGSGRESGIPDAPAIGGAITGTLRPKDSAKGVTICASIVPYIDIKNPRSYCRTKARILHRLTNLEIVYAMVVSVLC